jgi:hypothetical protein
VTEHGDGAKGARGQTGRVHAILVEFDAVRSFVDGTRAVREAGFTRWDTHTPFPVHGIERLMGIKRTVLPFVVFGVGVTGLSLALLMQWWMNAHDYKLVISGKPLFSLPANIPVVFEITVLLSAATTFFGMLILNRLPRYHNPLFKSERFRRVTTDRFFISIEASDPKFAVEETLRLANSLGGVNVEIVEEE